MKEFKKLERGVVIIKTALNLDGTFEEFLAEWAGISYLVEKYKDGGAEMEMLDPAKARMFENVIINGESISSKSVWLDLTNKILTLSGREISFREIENIKIIIKEMQPPHDRISKRLAKFVETKDVKEALSKGAIFNGKVYTGNSVYIEGVKYTISPKDAKIMRFN